VLHMHGRLRSALCAACGERAAWTGPLSDAPPCQACGASALRPDVVWFGEMPYHMDRIEEHLLTCDLFAAVGTSGKVYPAAGFVEEATFAGARTVELNLSDSDVSRIFQEHRVGPASRIVPEWVAALLRGIPSCA